MIDNSLIQISAVAAKSLGQVVQCISFLLNKPLLSRFFQESCEFAVSLQWGSEELQPGLPARNVMRRAWITNQDSIEHRIELFQQIQIFPLPKVVAVDVQYRLRRFVAFPRPHPMLELIKLWLQVSLSTPFRAGQALRLIILRSTAMQRSSRKWERFVLRIVAGDSRNPVIAIGLVERVQGQLLRDAVMFDETGPY